MQCPRCRSKNFIRDKGKAPSGAIRFRCKDCNKQFNSNTGMGINNKDDHRDKQQTRTYTENGNDAKIEQITNHQIKTLEEMVIFCEIDTEQWIVDRWLCNKWEVGMRIDDRVKVQPLWQVKVWLKRNTKNIAINDIKERVLKEIKSFAPVYPKIEYKKFTDPVMLEVNLFDFHFGKLVWGKESGKNYDLKIAKKLFIDCVKKIINLASPYQVEKVLFIVGNDFFNVNSSAAQTFSGTPQSEDDRWKKTFHEGWKLVRDAIDMLTAIAPVDVVDIPGNHDFESAFYLGEVLAGVYEKNPNVIVDNNPKLRKYYRYGNNLIGFTHGKDEKINELPLIMANEAGKDFSDTTYREWHLGDKHHKKDIKWIATEEIKGVTVRILRSLSATDQWHYSKGYINNVRAGEAFIWHKKNGLICNLSVNYD